MSLPGAGRAEQGDVGLVGGEGQRGQVTQLAGVQVGLESEVELVDRPVMRQPGQFQGVAERRPSRRFFLEDEVDEVEVVRFGSGSQVGCGVGQVSQAEAQGMVFDPGGDELAHEATAAWVVRPAMVS